MYSSKLIRPSAATLMLCVGAATCSLKAEDFSTPTYTYVVKAPNDTTKDFYAARIVGRNPYHRGHRTTTIPVYILPLVMSFADGYASADPSNASTSCPVSGNLINKLIASPVFTPSSIPLGGTHVGVPLATQFLDGFVRAAAWQSLGEGKAHRLLLETPKILPKYAIGVPAGFATFLTPSSYDLCATKVYVDGPNFFEPYLNNFVLPQIIATNPDMPKNALVLVMVLNIIGTTEPPHITIPKGSTSGTFTLKAESRGTTELRVSTDEYGQGPGAITLTAGTCCGLALSLIGSDLTFGVDKVSVAVNDTINGTVTLKSPAAADTEIYFRVSTAGPFSMPFANYKQNGFAGFHSSVLTGIGKGLTWAVATINTANKATNLDLSTVMHEIGEWAFNPYVNRNGLANSTPPWGHTGQVDGCQGNLETGDPLSSNTFILSNTSGQFIFQDLAFPNWFYGITPSDGVNGWFSMNGTFKTTAAKCN